jgi:hydrogenase maturation factor HypF (carbamoyltransferase family)
VVKTPTRAKKPCEGFSPPPLGKSLKGGLFFINIFFIFALNINPQFTMIPQKEIDKQSKYYENKNAHSNCPECDSLNTFYYRNTLHCKECGAEYFMKTLDKKTIERLLKTASFIAVLGILAYLFV